MYSIPDGFCIFTAMKWCLLTLMISLVFPLRAIELGRKTSSLSGQLQMSFSSYRRDALPLNRFVLGLAPDYGFFAAKQFSLGPRLGYRFSQETAYASSSSGTKRYVTLIHELTLGGAFRYYVRLGEKTFVSFLLSPAGMVGTLEPRPSQVKTVREEIAFDLQAGPALHIFVHPRLSLDIGLMYQFTRGTERFRIDGNIISPVSFTRHGFLFSIGFSNFFYRLPKTG